MNSCKDFLCDIDSHPAKCLKVYVLKHGLVVPVLYTVYRGLTYGQAPQLSHLLVRRAR